MLDESLDTAQPFAALHSIDPGVLPGSGRGASLPGRGNTSTARTVITSAAVTATVIVSPSRPKLRSSRQAHRAALFFFSSVGHRLRAGGPVGRPTVESIRTRPAAPGSGLAVNDAKSRWCPRDRTHRPTRLETAS